MLNMQLPSLMVTAYLLFLIRNCHTVFHSDYSILQSCWQCVSDPVYPHLHQHLVLSLFLIYHSDMCIEVSLLWFDFCISLIANEVEHLFMCLLVIYMSSLAKSLCMVFSHFQLIFFIASTPQVFPRSNPHPEILY